MEDQNNTPEPQLQQPVEDATPKLPPEQEQLIRQLLQSQARENQLRQQVAQQPQAAPQNPAPKKAPSQSQQVLQQMQAMQQELAAMKQQREQEAEYAKWEQVSSQVADFVNGTEDFPGMKAGVELNVHQMARDEIEDHYRRTGEVMPLEKAASNVEAWLSRLVEQLAPAYGFARPQGSTTTLTNSDSSQKLGSDIDPWEFAKNPFAVKR